MKDSNGRSPFLKFIESYQLKINKWLREDRIDHALTIFFVFSLLIAYMTIPESMKINYPTSIKDVGSVLKYSVRASRDYIITNEEKTKQNRLLAEKDVPLFYVASESENASKTIKNAFGHMRESAKEHLEKTISSMNTEIPDEYIKLAASSVPALPKNPGEAAFIRNELFSHFERERDAFHKILGFPVSSEIFTILSSNFFSSFIEKSIEDIMSRLNTYYVSREGIPADYGLPHVSIKKGEAVINVPVAKIITGSTLREEIRHTQLILQHDKEFTETGINMMAELVFWVLKDNISYSASLTEESKLVAWNNAPKEEFKIKNGEIIKRAGEVLTKRDIMVFQEMAKQTSQRSLPLIYLQNLIFIMIFSVVLLFSFKKTVSKFSSRNKDILLICIQTIFSIIIFEFIVSLSIPFSNWMGSIDARIFYFLMPVPFVIATVRLLVNSETAICFLIFTTALFILTFPDNFYFPVFYLAGSLFYMFLVTHIEKRGNIIKVSFFLSLFLMMMTVLIFLMDQTLPFDNLPRALLLTFSGAMLSGMLIMAIIPVYEWLFGYTTEITFLEYSTLNHPLMKRMAVHANGTYQHSLTLGSIVEVAAREIGLSSLACKVMAYFHDIGKLERPEYFTENQAGKNIHDELPSHSMSAMVIINHVKQGLELAKKYRLGEKIEDAVSQHHGTTLVEYFYKQAKKGDKNVSESTYRYPGPKPASREAALLMVADSCEAAVRSIPEKNYQKISDTVVKIIAGKLADGQLSECNMTLKDLKKIEMSIIKTLSGIYHARIEYPDQK